MIIKTSAAARAAIMYPVETLAALARRDAPAQMSERFFQAIVAWNRETSLASHYVGKASHMPVTEEEAAMDALCERPPRPIGDVDPHLRSAFDAERRAVQEAVEDRFAILVAVADEIAAFLADRQQVERVEPAAMTPEPQRAAA